MTPLLSVQALRSRCIDPATNHVFSLDDLRSRRRAGTFLAVIGDPVAHSLSPRMHKTALEALAAVDSQFFAWHYIKVKVAAEELKHALPLFHSRGFMGLNVTIPHKIAIIPLLTGLTSRAQAIGAVNVLTRTPMGYEGDNKDAEGFLYAAEHLLAQAPGRALEVSSFGLPPSIDWAQVPVVVWGAGGGARAAIYQLLQEGVKTVYVGNRSSARLEALEAALKPLCSPDVQWHSFLFKDIPADLPKNALFVQATPQGLSESDPLPIPLSLFGPSASLYDMAYSQNETPMVHAVREKGLRAADGRLMLARQGALALEQWTGQFIATALMLNALIRP